MITSGNYKPADFQKGPKTVLEKSKRSEEFDNHFGREWLRTMVFERER